MHSVSFNGLFIDSLASYCWCPATLQNTLIHQNLELESGEENPPIKSTQNKKRSSEQVFLNNYPRVLTHVRGKKAKVRANFSKKARVNAPFFLFWEFGWVFGPLLKGLPSNSVHFHEFVVRFGREGANRALQGAFKNSALRPQNRVSTITLVLKHHCRHQGSRQPPIGDLEPHNPWWYAFCCSLRF